MPTVKRKTFVARKDLIEHLSSIAKQKGFSLYDTVNEVFELALKAEETGVDLRTIIDERWVLKEAKEAGFVLGLENLWYDMSELTYETAGGQALKCWFEAGVWLAKRYLTAEKEGSFDTFKRNMEAFTWNAPEFIITKEGREVTVRVVSPRFPKSYTFMFVSFLEGALETFGYKVANREVGKGIVRLEAFKEEAGVSR